MNTIAFSEADTSGHNGLQCGSTRFQLRGLLQIPSLKAEQIVEDKIAWDTRSQHCCGVHFFPKYWKRAINDVHRKFVILEIPNRKLFIKGWSIGLCSPEKLNMGNNTEDWRVMDMAFAWAILVSKSQCSPQIISQQMRSSRRLSGMTIVIK